jgi:pimeloyl-ACP methyl ester carboxylesterase
MATARTATHSVRKTSLMTALAILGGALALLAVVSSAQSADAAKEPTPKPTIVLVHGAWADSTGWSGVIKRLDKDGYDVLAPATPLRSLSGDAAYVASFLAQTPGPIVLVGHSYGGAVITNAAAGHDNVKALVYIDGFAPDIGENTLALAGADSLIPLSIEFKGIPPFGPTDVDVYIKKESFRETFAADVSKREAALMAVAQRPAAAATGSEPTTATAWKTIPSWYLVGRQDRTITPEAQRFMAHRAGSTTVEIDSSHVSMISHPGAVADLIEAAANATAAG